MLSESPVEEMEGRKPKGKLNKSTINMLSIQKIIQVAMGGIIIHWLEDIFFSSGVKDNPNYNKGSSLNSEVWGVKKTKNKG